MGGSRCEAGVDGMGSRGDGVTSGWAWGFWGDTQVSVCGCWGLSGHGDTLRQDMESSASRSVNFQDQAVLTESLWADGVRAEALREEARPVGSRCPPPLGGRAGGQAVEEEEEQAEGRRGSAGLPAPAGPTR